MDIIHIKLGEQIVQAYKGPNAVNEIHQYQLRALFEQHFEAVCWNQFNYIFSTVSTFSMPSIK